MGTGKKKKSNKAVIGLISGLVLICILIFMLPNLLNQEEVRAIKELEENVIQPHLSTIYDDFIIVSVINISRYQNQETEESTTYEVTVRYKHEPETIGDRTVSESTVTYNLVMKDDEVLSFQ